MCVQGPLRLPTQRQRQRRGSRPRLEWCPGLGSSAGTRRPDPLVKSLQCSEPQSPPGQEASSPVARAVGGDAACLLRGARGARGRWVTGDQGRQVTWLMTSPPGMVSSGPAAGREVQPQWLEDDSIF